jgi:hypothetical protein
VPLADFPWTIRFLRTLAPRILRVVALGFPAALAIHGFAAAQTPREPIVQPENRSLYFQSLSG